MIHERLLPLAAGAGALLLTAGLVSASAQEQPRSGATGSRVDREAAIAVQQPGPHEGGGVTTAYPFFSDLADLPIVFRKRALHPGSAIGHHEQREDEIYYVLSGTGELVLDGVRTEVGPGTAILTRPGSTHSLKQTGKEDLVIFIVYPKH